MVSWCQGVGQHALRALLRILELAIEWPVRTHALGRTAVRESQRRTRDGKLPSRQQAHAWLRACKHMHVCMIVCVRACACLHMCVNERVCCGRGGVYVFARMRSR